MKQTLLLLLLLALVSCNRAEDTSAPAKSMLNTDTVNTAQTWHASAALTVGDTIGDYTAPGLLDGIGVFDVDHKKSLVLINHELKNDRGNPYSLANGTILTGARISAFTISRDDLSFITGGLAYDTVVDRKGAFVTDPLQVNEKNHSSNGFSRFCSARGIQTGEYGFVDNIYLTGEEAGRRTNRHGGSIWALDVRRRVLYAVPALGRGAWENVTPLNTGNDETIALLLGDDHAPAPLYLYIGTKDRNNKKDFLARNGLAHGEFYCWKSTTAVSSAENFNGSGNKTNGHFVPLKVRMAAQTSHDGYDSGGYLDASTLRNHAWSQGCFRFSRPEDLHNNPAKPQQAIFADSGHGRIHPANDWGSLYLVDIDFGGLDAHLSVVYDGDDHGHRDDGIRSPDNLTWADDGMIYIQEDRATRRNSFGKNGKEASIWELDPNSGSIKRIAEINRQARIPAGTYDRNAGKIGAWESSGIVDVTRFFDTLKGETLLLTTVQAHGLKGGDIIGGDENLVESGQLLFLSNRRAFEMRTK